jgi:hypothetical protein
MVNCTQECQEYGIDGVLRQPLALLVDLPKRATRMNDIAIMAVVLEERGFEPHHQDRHDRHDGEVGHEHRAVVARGMQQAVRDGDGLRGVPDHKLVDPDRQTARQAG